MVTVHNNSSKWKHGHQTWSIDWGLFLDFSFIIIFALFKSRLWRFSLTKNYLKNQASITLHCSYSAGRVPPGGVWFHLFVEVCVCVHFWNEGFGWFSLWWVKCNSWSIHAFQALTLRELLPVARGQDVDEGRNIDSFGVLTCLKQSLQVQNKTSITS